MGRIVPIGLLPLAGPGAPARRSRPGDREVDEAVEQLGVGNAGHLPQPRVHRDRREAGIVFSSLTTKTPSSRRKKSTRAIASTAAGLERAHREPLHLGGLLGRQRRGRAQLGLAVLVLVGVVVEVGGRARPRRAATPPADRRRGRRPRSRDRRTISSASTHSSYGERVRDRVAQLARVRALLTPTDEPMFAGLTKHG